MLVSNDPTLAAIVVAAVEGTLDCRIRWIGTGDPVWRHMMGWRSAVVVCDIDSASYDCLAALSQLRLSQADSSVPMIAVYSGSNDAGKALVAAGYRDVIAYPFDLEADLVETIRRRLAERAGSSSVSTSSVQPSRSHDDR